MFQPQDINVNDFIVRFDDALMAYNNHNELMEQTYQYSDGNVDNDLEEFFMAAAWHPIHEAGKYMADCKFSEDNEICIRQSQVYREFRENMVDLNETLANLRSDPYSPEMYQVYEGAFSYAVWFVQRAYFVMKHAYECLHEASNLASEYYDSNDWKRENNPFTRYNAIGGMSDEYREEFFREWSDGVRSIRDEDGGYMFTITEFAEFLGMNDEELDNF